MMKRTAFPRAAVLAALALVAALPAAASLSVPALEGRVVDRADVLSSSDERDIESYLAAVESRTGAQVAVLTVPGLEGDSLEAYSIRVAEQWGLGSKDRDDGVLLLVSLAEREIRIEVGYGLEGVLTDAACGFIIRDAIVPEFRRGDYAGGIEAGAKAIGGAVTGDDPITESDIADAQRSEENAGGGIPVMFIVFFVFMIIGNIGRARRYRRRGMSPGAAFLAGSLLGSAGRRSSGGFGGGFSGGGGGFSGGGGGFGGGGASGGW